MSNDLDPDGFPNNGVDINVNVLRGDYNALKALYTSLEAPNVALDKILQEIEYEWENASK